MKPSFIARYTPLMGSEDFSGRPIRFPCQMRHLTTRGFLMGLSCRRVRCQLHMPEQAVPFDRALVERDFLLDKTSTGRKIPAGHRFDRCHSVYALWVQSGDARATVHRSLRCLKTESRTRVHAKKRNEHLSERTQRQVTCSCRLLFRRELKREVDSPLNGIDYLT